MEKTTLTGFISWLVTYECEPGCVPPANDIAILFYG